LFTDLTPLFWYCWASQCLQIFSHVLAFSAKTVPDKRLALYIVISQCVTKCQQTTWYTIGVYIFSHLQYVITMCYNQQSHTQVYNVCHWSGSKEYQRTLVIAIKLIFNYNMTIFQFIGIYSTIHLVVLV